MENKKEQSGKTDKILYQVPPSGSLGLLALGYKGLYAWRTARQEFIKKQQEEKNGPKKG